MQNITTTLERRATRGRAPTLRAWLLAAASFTWGCPVEIHKFPPTEPGDDADASVTDAHGSVTDADASVADAGVDATIDESVGYDSPPPSGDAPRDRSDGDAPIVDAPVVSRDADATPTVCQSCPGPVKGQGLPSCVDGGCSITCQAGLTLCNGNACIDVTTDGAHCGGCGKTCATGLVCSAGQCKASCPTGSEVCDTSCVDTSSDPDHCGSCTTKCARPTSNGGASCIGGQCKIDCETGYTACGTNCTDIQSNVAHCGGCGKTCNGTCVSGTCCASGAACVAGSPCLQQDPHNCGTCGHDCLGGACLGGKCQPTTIATTTMNAFGVNADNTNVYWSDRDGLHFCPKAGCSGAPTTLASDVNRSQVSTIVDPATGNLFAAGGSPSWVDSYSPAGARLFRAVPDGGAGAITIDANNLYWGAGYTIIRAQRDTTLPLLLASALPGPVRGLAVAAGTLLASTTDSPGEIVSIPTSVPTGDAGNAFFVLTTQPNIGQIAVSGNNLYFAMPGVSPTFNDGAIYKCTVSFCPSPVALMTGHRATGVVASATTLYFVINESLYSCPLDGCVGAPTLLLEGAAGMFEGAQVLAQDDTALYWVPMLGGVMRLAK